MQREYARRYNSNESGEEIAQLYKKKASYLKQYHNYIIKTHIYTKMVKAQ